MSDFDKEAERERLREKYERDQQKRESSERMSDLLLKGATMTNSHCGNCGDPIFRYDGDEFCPTCQQVVTDDQAVEEAAENDQQGDGDASDDGSVEQSATGEAAGRADAENGDTPDHIEIKQPDGPAVRTGADQAAADQPSESEPGAPEADANASEANATNAADANATGGTATGTNASGGSRSAPSGQSAPSPSGRQPSTGQRSPQGGPSTAPGDANDDFGAARASLVRTLRKHAERAENCDDPRRARDHLTAAREAAEALSALSGSY